MTISSTVRTAGPYTGTGSVNTYPFAFKVFQASDLLAQQTDTSGNITTLALTTNYSVTLNADQNANPGGSIVLNSNLPSGYKLILSSQVPELQGTSITNNGGFYPQVVENAFDYLTVLVQQLQTQLAQCTQLPLAVQGVSTTLPAPVGGSLLGWNAAGTAIVNTGASGIGAGSVMDVNVAANAAIQASKLQYQSSGTGSVARTVQDREQDVISVFDAMTSAQIADVRAFTYTKDVTSAINAAIANNPGKAISFPSGGYLISGPITISEGGITLVGSGFASTIFKTSSATADLIQINCGTNTLSYIEIREILLDATSAKTAGYGISLTASAGGTCYHVSLSNVVMSPRMFSGLSVQSAYYLNLDTITVQSIGSGGCGFRFVGVNGTSQVAGVYGRNLRVESGTSNGTTYGMFIDSFCQGFYLSDVTLESSGLDVGLYLNNTSGVHANAPQNLWFTRLIADSCNNNGIIIIDCTTARFTDCWTTSSKNSGIYINAGIDIELKGHSSIANGLDGYTINGGSQIRILGGVCDANSATAHNTASGVNVRTGVSDWSVCNVDFLRSGSTPQHYADVYVTAGSSDRYQIFGNRCRGGVTYLVFDGGTGPNKWIQQNENFNPRGFSVAQPTVPASGTSVTNATGQDCVVYISGGTVTAITVGSPGGSHATGITGSNVAIAVPAGGYINVTYSAVFTWTWYGN